MSRNAAFRGLFVSRTVSYLGDSLGLVVLMLYVADATGQALAVGLLLLAGDFAPSLLAPLAGALSDRFDLRRLMIVCDLAQAALVGFLVMRLPPLPFLLVLVGVRALAGQVFAPASRSAMPSVVDDGDLETANALLGLGTNASEVLGPVLAAALFPLLGVRGILAVDAATFVASAIAITSLPALPRAKTSEPSTLLMDARIGMRYVIATPVVRVIVLGFAAVVAFNGVDDLAVVFLVKDELRGGNSATALALAGVGVGLIIGYTLLNRSLLGQSRTRVGMSVVFTAGLTINSAGNLLTGLAWAATVVFAMQTIRGVGIAGIDVGSTTMLQRLVPGDLTGRVFGNLYGLVGASAGLSYLAGGLLLDATSPRTTLLVAGAGGLAATAVVGWRLHARRPREP